MSANKLQERLVKTNLAVSKLLPVVGPFIALFDELNTIWSDQPSIEEAALQIQEDLMGNLARMIDENDAAAQKNMTDVAKKLMKTELPRLLSTMPPMINRSTHFIDYVLGTWLSLGLGATMVNDDYYFAVEYLSDIDFLYVFRINETFQAPE